MVSELAPSLELENVFIFLSQSRNGAMMFTSGNYLNIPRYKFTELYSYGTALYDPSETRRIMYIYYHIHVLLYFLSCNTLWFVFIIFALKCTWRKSGFVKCWHHLLNFWDIGSLVPAQRLGFYLDRVHRTRDVVGKFTRSDDRSFSSGNVVILRGGPTTWIIKLKEINYSNVYNRLDELLALLN